MKQFFSMISLVNPRYLIHDFGSASVTLCLTGDKNCLSQIKLFFLRTYLRLCLSHGSIEHKRERFRCAPVNINITITL